MNYGDTLAQRIKLNRISPKVVHEARKALAPILARRSSLRGETFQAWPDAPGLKYLVHPHNSTWRNERAVEIALAADFLERHGTGTGMEFGNVLSHYNLARGWPVVDKYEQRPGVINVDILDYRPRTALDCLVSVSTLEHVGWDERPREDDKAIRAFHHLRAMLAPTGQMLLTVPMGHNTPLDAAILAGELPVERQMTLVRQDGRWRRTDTLEWRAYRGSGRGADSVWVAEVMGARRTGS